MLKKKNRYKTTRKKNRFYTKKKQHKNKKKIIFKKKNIYKKKINNLLYKKNKNKKNNKIKKQKKKTNNSIYKKNKNNNIIKKNKNIAKKINKKKKINLYKRAPIISIMGHVNHGKTSLIDYIRSTNIAKTEKGNITQYINAYYIKNKLGDITLLDTPGHSIFTNMRSRGIDITDIIFLIIAIDDGIMPQTLEIINYSQKYNIPIIIGLSKIDKTNYLNNIDTIKKKISKYNIIPEEWGGNNIFVKFSVKKQKGIKKIFKAIKKESNKINLNTNINNYASGFIIESYINKKKGIMTNILIKDGKLKVGDLIISDNNFGKIKLILNDKKKKIKYALPSMPIKILGLSNISLPGKKFIIVKNKKKAKKIIKLKNKNITYKKKNKKTKNIFTKKNNKINFLLKTDVYGSLETIKISTKKIFKNQIKFIFTNVGNINENDLILASTSKSIILAFNIKIDNFIKNKINKYNIKIYSFNIVYKLIKKIKKIIKKKNKYTNKIKIGKAKVKSIFNISKNNIIIGCIVTKGEIKQSNPIQIKRNNYIIYKGKIKSLKRFKKTVKKIKKGMECGIYIKNFTKVNIGDIIECIKNNKTKN